MVSIGTERCGYSLFIGGGVRPFGLQSGNAHQGWAIAHFEKVQLLFFCAKKVHSHIFAHLFFLKERMCYCTFYRTCSKSKKCAVAHSHIFKRGKMYDRTFAHFHRVTKSAIAQSLFRNERMCKNVQKSANFKIALFLHSKKIANRSCKKGECAKMWEKCANSHFFAHFHTFAHF